jgi:hypothetical protein
MAWQDAVSHTQSFQSSLPHFPQNGSQSFHGSNHSQSRHYNRDHRSPLGATPTGSSWTAGSDSDIIIDPEVRNPFAILLSQAQHGDGCSQGLQFLLEAVTLSLIGGLLGVLAGVGGSYLSSAVGSMRARVVTASIPLAFLAAAVVGIFFGYYPATKAAQLEPIVALRHE